MDRIAFEIIVLIALILLNGFFSMTEMAIVSARKSRLQAKAEQGERGAATALELSRNSNRFLSTVQIGISLIGVLSGAFGGATLAEEIGLALAGIPWIAPYSEAVGVGVMVLIITYFSLVLGELVPKQLALNDAEKIATWYAPVMNALSVALSPVVKALSVSTDLVLHLVHAHPSDEPDVTEEDVRSMLDEGANTGVFEEVEQNMVERIFRLNDRGVSTLMTPRMDVVFLDLEETAQEIFEKIDSHPFSRYPLIQDSSDNVLGIIEMRDLLMQNFRGEPFDLEEVLKPALFIPEATTALETLEWFKRDGVEMGLVIDEFGGILGLVSMEDLLEAIVGEMHAPGEEVEAEAVQREDGSWLFDGLIQVDDLKDLLDLKRLPQEDENLYETLSGMMMATLGRVPDTGDHFEWDVFRFEVVDMDGRRVDKVLVTRRVGDNITGHGC